MSDLFNNPKFVANQTAARNNASKSGADGAVNTAAAAKTDGQSNIDPTSIPGKNRMGDDLISNAGKSNTSAATGSSTSATDNAAQNANAKVEPSASETVTDPDSWSKESSLKEVKKLRDENRITRIKYEESLQSMKAETEARLAAQTAELQKLADAQRELEELKQKEADKKRTLEDKLLHRESLLAEMKAQQDAKEKMVAQKLSAYETEISKYRAENEAQSEVYKKRLETELSKVPEKFRDVASYIVKGAGDARDALIALSEAQLKGVFEDKHVVVSHSVPGANDGARLDQKKIDEQAAEARKNMNPADKIRASLKDIRAGIPNTAFRSNR